MTLDGTEIALRPKEFDVIKVLAESAGAAVTRERLIDEVWDENWWGSARRSTSTSTRCVASSASRPARRAGSPIRGVGYRLERERPTT